MKSFSNLLINVNKKKSHQFVHLLFDQITKKFGNRIALIEGENRITYQELGNKSNLYAQALQKLGVAPNDTVAILMHRSIEFVIALLGILKTYANYLPLDPLSPHERNSLFIRKSNASWMITENEIKETAFNLINEKNCLISNKISIERHKYKFDLIKTKKIFHRKIPIPLYTIFTSGSTGEPKGVLGSHEALINRIGWMSKTYSFQENEILCQKTPVSFVDHVAEIFQALLNGLPLVIIPDKDARDAIKLADSIYKYSITRIILVPSLLDMLLYLPDEYIKQLYSLKFIFSSGETLTKKIANKCHEKLPHIRLINIYGSSEISADVTYHEDNSHVEDRIKKIFIPPTKKKHLHKEKDNFLLTQTQFLSTEIPEYGESFPSYYSFLAKKVTPFSVNVSEPSFIGHMTSGIPNGFGNLSKHLTELNQNLVKIETSASFTFLENQAIGMLHQLIYNRNQSFYIKHLKNPNSCLGISLNGGTLANIQALHIARHQALLKLGATKKEIQSFGFDKVAKKFGFKDVCVIGSPLLHYSIKKASLVLGIGINSIVHIPLNDKGILDYEQLEATINKLKNKNVFILALIGIAGTTETGSIDPLNEIAQIAFKNNIYFHVDAAWGGPFLFSDRLKNKLIGIEKADSVTICGHKQLCLPMGTSALLLKDPSVITPLQINANYQARKSSWDLGKFTLVGSKPANSTYFHAGFKILGKSGYRYIVENGYQLAHFFSNLVQSSCAFELIKQPTLNIVNYRYIPSFLRKKKNWTLKDQSIISKFTKKIQQIQFSEGKTFVSFTELPSFSHFPKKIGIFRAVFLNPLTQISDLNNVLNEQLTIAENYLNEPIQEKINFVYEKEETSVPIGFPIDNADIYILDSKLKTCKLGEIGEIYVGGRVLSLGYIGETPYPKETFKPDPFNSKKLIYKTGDFGRLLPNGAIEFLGRIDQRIKIKGCRIDLIEIENALLTIDQIDQACVLVNNQENRNELIATYFNKHNLSLDPKEIRNKLNKKLPKYMIPSYFFQIDLYPLLINGKIDKQSLIKKIKDTYFNSKNNIKLHESLLV